MTPPRVLLRLTPAQRYERASFLRAFLLGRAYESGATLTTRQIRDQYGVSKATAKRDLQRIQSLVPECTAGERGERQLSKHHFAT